MTSRSKWLAALFLVVTVVGCDERADTAPSAPSTSGGEHPAAPGRRLGVEIGTFADENTLTYDTVAKKFKEKNGGTTDTQVATANKDGTPTTPSMRTIGTGAQQAAAGTHAAQHKNGGADEVAVSAPAANAILKLDGGGQFPIGAIASGSCNGSTFVRGDRTCAAPAGGGDALTSQPLNQFAATNSNQFAGVISDETGTGAVVLGTNPVLSTPGIASFSSATHNHQNAAGGGTLDGAAIAAGQVAAARLPAATTSAPGIVQLIDSTSSTSTTVAPTANAVKLVNDGLAARVAKAGDTMSGALNMGGNQVTNAADPATAQALATKNYVDTPPAEGTFTFSGSGGARSLDVSSTGSRNWIETDTLTGTLAITLTGGADGYGGKVCLKSDGTPRTVTFAASGRTNSFGANASIPAAANVRYCVGYEYSTLGGTAYLILYPVPLDSSAGNAVPAHASSHVSTGTDPIPQLQSIIAPTQITSSQNDYNPTGWDTAEVVRLTSDATRSISGFVPSTTPKILINANSTANLGINLLFDAGASSAANRIYTPNSTPYLLNPVSVSGSVARIWYDAATTHWVVITTTMDNLALPKTGGTMTGSITETFAYRQTPAAVTLSANTATIDVSTNNTFQIATALAANFTLTLTNGNDGDEGTISWRQDATGGRKLTALTTSGRTQIMAGNLTTVNTTNAIAANAQVTMSYSYRTAGTQAVIYLNVFDTVAAAYTWLERSAPRPKLPKLRGERGVAALPGRRRPFAEAA